MLPPTSVCSDPPIVPKIDLDRTMMPRTTPRLRAILYASSVNVLVVGVRSIASRARLFDEVRACLASHRVLIACTAAATDRADQLATFDQWNTAGRRH